MYGLNTIALTHTHEEKCILHAGNATNHESYKLPEVKVIEG